MKDAAFCIYDAGAGVNTTVGLEGPYRNSGGGIQGKHSIIIPSAIDDPAGDGRIGSTCSGCVVVVVVNPFAGACGRIKGIDLTIVVAGEKDPAGYHGT